MVPPLVEVIAEHPILVVNAQSDGPSNLHMDDRMHHIIAGYPGVRC